MLVLVAVGCGLAGGVGAIFFRSLIHFFTELFFGNGGGWLGSPRAALALALDFAHREPMELGSELPWWRRVAAPVLGGLLVADEVIDLLLPALFYHVRARRWRRMHAERPERKPLAA